jgi:hypothetical protein
MLLVGTPALHALPKCSDVFGASQSGPVFLVLPVARAKPHMRQQCRDRNIHHAKCCASANLLRYVDGLQRRMQRHRGPNLLHVPWDVVPVEPVAAQTG